MFGWQSNGPVIIHRMQIELAAVLATLPMNAVLDIL